MRRALTEIETDDDAPAGAGGMAFRRTDARGMSLVETLAALAILAVVASIFFQSTGQWARLAGRASDVAENATARSIASARFAALVAGLTPGWPETPEDVFSGGPAAFSGLTRSPLETEAPALARITLSIEAEDLRYRADGADWAIAAIGEGEARFSYLGADGVWRERWPPPETPDPGRFGDAAFFDTPQIPLAIRLDSADYNIIAAVGSTPSLPLRVRDSFGDQQ